MRRELIIALLCAAFTVTSFDAEAKRKRLSLGSWGGSKTTTSNPSSSKRKNRYRGSIAGGAVDLGTSAYDGYNSGSSSSERSDRKRHERNEGSVERGKCIVGLPKSFELHAVGVYEGTRTKGSNLRIGKRNRRAEQVDVYVARTHRPAVLVLGAHEPIVWAINPAKNANIAGVLVRGYNSQAVSGLPEDVPVVFSTYRDGLAKGCGSSRASHTRSGEKGDWTKELQTVFGRSITSFKGAYRGHKIGIGQWTGLDTAPALPIDRDEMIASGRIGRVSHTSAGLGGGLVLLLVGGMFFLRRRAFGGGVLGILFGSLGGW